MRHLLFEIQITPFMWKIKEMTKKNNEDNYKGIKTTIITIIIKLF